MYILLHDCREEFRSLVFLDRSTRLQVFKQIYFVLLASILLNNWIQNWGNNLIFSTNFLSLFLKRILSYPENAPHYERSHFFAPSLLNNDKCACTVLDALYYDSQNNHSLHLNGGQTGSKKKTNRNLQKCLFDWFRYLCTYFCWNYLDSRLIHRYILR